MKIHSTKHLRINKEDILYQAKESLRKDIANMIYCFLQTINQLLIIIYNYI